MASFWLTDIGQNRLKVVGAANYAMNENPERMFIYGVMIISLVYARRLLICACFKITIEANVFTLWYFSRSHSAMSESFDWMQVNLFCILILVDGAEWAFLKNPKIFVTVLLSFIYATPVELGFDPNVKEYTPTPPGPQYFIYTINDGEEGMAYFKTLRCLSEYRSLCISGRSTRVWKAIQIKSLDDHSPVNCAKEVVLKDIWLGQDAQTERELQTNLFTDIGAYIKRTLPGGCIPQLRESGSVYSELIQDLLGDEKWKKHFLTILFDGIGVPCKERPVSARPDPTLFDEPIDEPVAPRSQGADHSRAYSTSVLHEQTSSTSAAPAAPRTFAPKHRYFVVFQELCKAVEDLTSFSDTMNALKHAVKGHFSMSF